MCRAAVGAKMLLVSTEYVFPGEGEGYYEVYDKTAPLNVYGASKRDAELALIGCSLLQRHLRTS